MRNRGDETEPTGMKRTSANIPATDAEYDAVRSAFRNAEEIFPENHQNAAPLDNSAAENNGGVVSIEQPRNGDLEVENCPVVPLGQKGGSYFFISASGELRCMRAEALETGRGVRALLSGFSRDIDAWCHGNFPAKDGGWSQRDAGHWIIEKCNAKGVFDPNSADIWSIGVWRDENGKAVAHCGNQLVHADRRFLYPNEHKGKCIMVGAAPINPPDYTPISSEVVESLLSQLRTLWGWKRVVDADIFLGWVAAASLGGFPAWRSHLYVYGSRGSGKSKLMEVAAKLLGEFAGSVLNDATEAGLRQSRNNQARPILIDEFEPDESARNGSRQDNMLALFRRMSGGDGGRVSRGGADHSSVSFRSLGAAYVTSINHIQLEPQDRSRFVMIDLGQLPNSGEPRQTMSNLSAFEQTSQSLSSRLKGRILAQSGRWDETHAVIAAVARRGGADARQADTAATILAGRDLALFESEIDQARLDDLQPILNELTRDAADSGAASEGDDALDYLLSSSLNLDHGVKRTIGELLISAIDQTPVIGVEDPGAALSRVGVFVLPAKTSVAVRAGRKTPVALLYAGTKWQNGAHTSALLSLEGVSRPNSAMRVSRNQQCRVVLVPNSLISDPSSENCDDFE